MGTKVRKSTMLRAAAAVARRCTGVHMLGSSLAPRPLVTSMQTCHFRPAPPLGCLSPFVAAAVPKRPWPSVTPPLLSLLEQHPQKTSSELWELASGNIDMLRNKTHMKAVLQHLKTKKQIATKPRRDARGKVVAYTYEIHPHFIQKVNTRMKTRASQIESEGHNEP